MTSDHRPRPATTSPPGAANLSDTFSRTALAFVHDGTATSLDHAQDVLTRATARIAVGPQACRTTTGQAAAMTAVATLSRAFGTVLVDLADPDAPVHTGPYPGGSLDQAVHRARPAGAGPTGGRAVAPIVELLIGDAEPAGTDTAIRAGWDGWTAASGPRAPTRCGDGHPLAGIVAAALAATEAFAVLRGRPGAAAATRSIDLWNPGSLMSSSTSSTPSSTAAPPRVAFLPPAWHLVGLGHIGQAAAWCLTFLPYRPGELQVLLQDVDTVVAANLSTGVLSSSTDVGRLKTRVVAEHLERAGARTRVVERRLDRHQRRAPSEPGLALIGVDNPTTRQLLDTPGWDLAIDLGLGHGHRDFSEIALHSIDTEHTAESVAAWAAPSSPPSSTPGAPGSLPPVPAFDAYRDAGPLERCGLVQLAGRAVGASFVGALASALGVNEALRRLAGAPATAVLTLDARRPDQARGALAPASPTARTALSVDAM